jgi:hypothetical protein
VLTDTSVGNGNNADSTLAPTYVSGWVGNALSLIQSNSQRVNAPYVNVMQRSFTIEMWVYWTTAAVSPGEIGLWGICSAQGQGTCVFLEIRPKVLWVAFWNNDVIGTTALTQNTWFHAAAVFDQNSTLLSLYYNGVPYASRIQPYNLTLIPGTNMTLGWCQTAQANYFGGYLDHVTISDRAKSACEILQDATLTVYLPFDNVLTDGGPNFYVPTPVGQTYGTGHLNQAVFFSASNSRVIISGITVLGQTASSFSLPYSFSLWLSPTASSLTGAAIIHVSSSSSGNHTYFS